MTSPFTFITRTSIFALLAVGLTLPTHLAQATTVENAAVDHEAQAHKKALHLFAQEHDFHPCTPDQLDPEHPGYAQLNQALSALGAEPKDITVRFANNILNTPADEMPETDVLRAQVLAHMFVVKQFLGHVGQILGDFTPAQASAVATRAAYLVDETLGASNPLKLLMRGETPTAGTAFEILMHLQSIVQNDPQKPWKEIQSNFDEFVSCFGDAAATALDVIRTRLLLARDYINAHPDVVEASEDDMLGALNSVALDWPDEGPDLFTNIIRAALDYPLFAVYLYDASIPAQTDTDDLPDETTAEILESTVRRRLGDVLQLFSGDAGDQTIIAHGLAWLAMHPDVAEGSPEDALSSAATIVTEGGAPGLVALAQHLGTANDESDDDDIDAAGVADFEQAAPQKGDLTPERFNEAYKKLMRGMRAPETSSPVIRLDMPDAALHAAKDDWMKQELQLNPSNPEQQAIIAALAPLLDSYDQATLHELWQRLFLLMPTQPEKVVSVFNYSIKWLQGPGAGTERGSAEDLLTAAGPLSSNWAEDSFLHKLWQHLFPNEEGEPA